MAGTDLHDHTSAVELPPEMIGLQIIQDDEGLEEVEQDLVVSTEVPHFEFVPQAFEIIPTSFSASQDSGITCLHYTFDPALNPCSTITWPWSKSSFCRIRAMQKNWFKIAKNKYVSSR